MKAKEVKQKIEEIIALKYDALESHQLRDQLNEDFVAAIANGEITAISDIVEMAALIYEMNELNLIRWYD